MQKLFALFLFIYLVKVSFAQDPAYFVIGQKELHNADVYSIYQSKTGVLYTSTNRGVFFYKNGNFIPVNSSPNQIGTSLFHLQENKIGEMHCCNFAGQVFKINQNNLELVYTHPYTSGGFDYYFDEINQLIVYAKDIVIIDSIGNKSAIDIEDRSIINLYKVGKSEFLFDLADKDSLYLLNSVTKKIEGFKRKHDPGQNGLHSYLGGAGYLGNELIVMNCYLSMYAKNDFTNEIPIRGAYRFHNNNNKEIFIQPQVSGFKRVYLDKNQRLKSSELFFPNIFCSDLFVNENGTIFIGTFGSGIYVIPDINVRQQKAAYNLRNIESANDSTAFFTTKTGEILKFSKDFTKADSVELIGNSKIFYLKNSGFQFLDFEEDLFVSYRKGAHIPSIKDVSRVNDTLIVMATASGILMYNQKGSLDSRASAYTTGDRRFYYIDTTHTRQVSILADPKNNRLYTSEYGRLLSRPLNSPLIEKELKFKGENINANDLIVLGDTLVVGTQKKGLLFFHDDKCIYQFNEDKGLLNNYIIKLRNDGSKIYSLTNKGLQIIDVYSKEILSPSSSLGIMNEDIADFDLSENKIWLISEQYCFQLDKTKIIPDNEKLTFSIDSIKMANHKLQENGYNEFSSKDNNLTIFLNYSVIEKEKEAFYHYRLEGFENEWQIFNSQNTEIEYRNLSPGEYSFKIFLQYLNNTSEIKTYPFVVLPPFWQRWWFYLLVIIVLAASLTLIFYFRLKALRKKNLQRLERERMKRELAISELKALRAQMNPHFIFNSLNSIQDLILREETDKSYDYIVLFADLVRKSLHYSNKDFIDIDGELEFLKVYLQLEKLRFGEDFTYEIKYIGEKHIRIPSLIIQPFIENAITHGLLHKKGPKKLWVEFEKNEDNLTCFVRDNGIGRTAAKEIKMRQGGHHESFSLSAIKERMRLLGKRFKGDAGYEIHDVMDDKNNSLGTEVCISVPYQDEF